MGVTVENDFAVGLGVKVMPVRLEFGAKLAEVVDLAIAHNHQRTVGIGDRLVAPGEVDDRQAPHPDGAAPVGVRPAIVGATVRRDRAHA